MLTTSVINSLCAEIIAVYDVSDEELQNSAFF